MKRREFLRYSVATAVAAPFVRAARADSGVVKVGVVGAKTGPLGPGAAVTHFPPYRLWAHEVNARGGLKLKEQPGKDRTDRIRRPHAAARNHKGRGTSCDGRQGGLDRRRLCHRLQSRRSAYFRQVRLPTARRLCVTDQAPALIKRYPGLFVFQQSTTTYAKGAIDVLKKLKDGGQIGNKVAVVNVGDDFGIELANVGRPLFKEAGFEIVYDKSYPLGSQDYVPVIKAAKSAKPDAFVAWSYPPDTFGLAEQAKIEDLNVKAYFSCVATAFQGFSHKFGPAAENVLGAGGMVDTPEVHDYFKRHKEVTGIDADYWGNAFYYAMLEILPRNPSKQSALWIVRQSLHISGTERSELFSANFPCRVRSSTRSTPSGNGRAASSRPCLASVSPTMRRSA